MRKFLSILLYLLSALLIIGMMRTIAETPILVQAIAALCVWGMSSTARKLWNK